MIATTIINSMRVNPRGDFVSFTAATSSNRRADEHANEINAICRAPGDSSATTATQGIAKPFCVLLRRWLKGDSYA
jgi:hypothetical protein